MNYFEHHIGDYAEATAHLTFVEDAAYSRLLRKYYATEKPLPPDLKAVQRLVAARTKEEREAVETVLNEFFTLQDDGWHNARCDSEIARFKDGEPEREVKKANEENRLKRHREERARLFKQLTANGLHAPWNISMAELRDMVKSLPATQPDTQVPPLPATAPATPATATQTPDTNHQTPVLKPGVAQPATTQPELRQDAEQRGVIPSEDTTATVGQLCIAMRAYGINADPGNMLMRKLAADGVTVEMMNAACEEAKRSKPNEVISPNYVIGIINRWAREAAALSVAGAQTPAAAAPRESWEWKRTPGGIEAKGRELGMFARGTENHADFAKRIEAEIEKRKGRAA
jgi:uncharacterized protein YdaU (DUF1376 family)